MTEFLTLAILTLTLGITWLFWLVYLSGRRVRMSMSRIPGPTPIPLFGNLFTLNVPNEDVFHLHKKFREQFGERYKLQFASSHYVALYNPKDIEKLLTSTLHIGKGTTYTLITPWLGEGLLTSQGSKWHKRRKMLTPSFHFRILENFVPIFNEHSNALVNILREEHDNGEEVDICPFIARCTLDIIGETAMDVKINAQNDRNNPYLIALSRLCELVLFRSNRPWYWTDTVWSMTSYGKDWKSSLKVLHDYTTNVIKTRKEFLLARGTNNGEEASSVVANARDDWQVKPKLAFLDLLLEAQRDPANDLTDIDIREEVDTFMFEGHDTTAAALNWAIFLIASNPECQQKLHKELDTIFGADRNRAVTTKDLTEMKYLELCIKESLRLFPSVPFLSRTLKSDLVLDEKTTIPEGVNIFLLPSHIHRNEAIFSKPELFMPERFLPENSINRHPFAYIPFSAGPRNCIGQKFAMMEEKVILANIFRNFWAEAAEPLENVLIVMEVVLRAKNGLKVKFIPR